MGESYAESEVGRGKGIRFPEANASKLKKTMKGESRDEKDRWWSIGFESWERLERKNERIILKE